MANAISTTVVSTKKNIRGLSIVAVSLVGGLLLGLGIQQIQNSQKFEVAIAPYQDVNLPANKPAATQENIDLAMKLFNIKVPSNVDSPIYDKDLKDRGLTTGEVSIGSRKKVTIGPAAFVSWSILGSTLGHEIEVHGNQSFSKIVFKNRFSEIYSDTHDFAAQWLPLQKQQVKSAQEGTLEAEQQAYLYEIQNSARFKLTNEEVKAIWSIVEQYFPIAKSSVFSFTARN